MLGADCLLCRKGKRRLGIRAPWHIGQKLKSEGAPGSNSNFEDDLYIPKNGIVFVGFFWIVGKHLLSTILRGGFQVPGDMIQFDEYYFERVAQPPPIPNGSFQF